MTTNDDYDPNAPIPTTIPAVVVDDRGEPSIVKERLIRPSGMPRALAVFLVLSALVSGFFIIKGDRDRAHDRDEFKASIEAQNKDFQAKIDEQIRRLDAQQALANQDRDALRNLILALLTTDDPAKARELLEEFTRQQAERSARTNRTASPAPSPRPGSQPTTKPSPTAMPRPTATARPTPETTPTPGTVSVMVCTPRVPLVGSKCVNLD